MQVEYLTLRSVNTFQKPLLKEREQEPSHAGG